MSMKAREIREHLKGKIPTELSTVLEAIAEEQQVQKQMIFEQAQMLDKVIDLTASMTEVASNMKGALNQMQKIDGEEDENGPVTQ